MWFCVLLDEIIRQRLRRRHDHLSWTRRKTKLLFICDINREEKSINNIVYIFVCLEKVRSTVCLCAFFCSLSFQFLGGISVVFGESDDISFILTILFWLLVWAVWVKCFTAAPACLFIFVDECESTTVKISHFDKNHIQQKHGRSEIRNAKKPHEIVVPHWNLCLMKRFQYKTRRSNNVECKGNRRK